jgi:hypothetical protein
LPVVGFFPQTSQTFDMIFNLLKIKNATNYHAF